MESIAHKIRFSVSSMGPAEKRIAEYLLQHSGEIINISVAELDEELSDLGLENDDYRQHSDIQYHVHDCRHQPHVEGRQDNPDDIE